jgi:large subunit ribosomal protein L13Ae
VGWKYQDIVAALEAKRKVKGEAFYKGKLEVAKAKAAVLKDPKIAKRIAPHQQVIESFGYQ